jgi:hypothetical protein
VNLNSFYTALFVANIDKGFRLFGFWILRVFEVGEHETKFRAYEDIYAFSEMPVIPGG